jgi:hypothetical protein
MDDHDHERRCCSVIEAVLFSATGRTPRGTVHDVLQELIRRTDFFTLADGRYGNALESDIGKLVDAIWSVIVSNDATRPCGIAGTLPGITGHSSKMEFVTQYAKDFFYGNGQLFDTDPRSESGEALNRRLEAHLVGAVCLFRIAFDKLEWFSLTVIYSEILRWDAVNRDWQQRAERVFGCLCRAFAVVEEAAEARC